MKAPCICPCIPAPTWIILFMPLPTANVPVTMSGFRSSFWGMSLIFQPLPRSGSALSRCGIFPCRGVEAVFFKTRNAPLNEFDPLFPWLTFDAAAWLARHPLLFAGIDQPGIERSQPDHETHIQLLSRDILIIEGLDLSQIEDGCHRFAAFTLNIRGVEAEPVLVYAYGQDR
jgi:hypothetical protein